MKSCVVFAVSVFREDRLYVLREFLDTFTKHFVNCDFYIGVNYGSHPLVETIIAESNLSTIVTRVERPELYCGSDASAYQAALELLKESKKTYNIYWFAHTKGAVNDRPYERNLYLTELFANRLEIEQLFKTYEHLGSYALRGVSRSAGGLNWATYNKDHYIDICSNEITEELPYTHMNWSYIETMYALSSKAVNTFLKLAGSQFYATKIEEPCYFETVFPWIATRCGQYSYTRQSQCFFGEGNILTVNKSWITENNLIHLNDYLAL